jgi:hypothetical protein
MVNYFLYSQILNACLLIFAIRLRSLKLVAKSFLGANLLVLMQSIHAMNDEIQKNKKEPISLKLTHFLILMTMPLWLIKYVFYSNSIVIKWWLVHDLSVHLTGDGPTIPNRITLFLSIFAMFGTGYVLTAFIGNYLIETYDLKEGELLN